MGLRKFVFLAGTLGHHEFTIPHAGFIPISSQIGKEILPFKIRADFKEQICADLCAFCVVDAHVRPE